MAETTWQYAVQDFSPLLTYAGGSSGEKLHLNSAWSQSCPSGGSSQLSGNTICDVASVHTTSAPGASVSLTFYGQAIQFIGTVTGSIPYDVDVDGSVSAGVPSSQLLASISNLTLGDHTISLTTRSSASFGSTLSFQGAIVTVGTGLTGANVTRTIIQDGDLAVQYSGNSWSIQQYDGWGIQHTSSNTTWHQVNTNATGSYSIPFSGSTVMIHGFSWSYYPSTNRVSIDNESAITYYANSSLADVGNPGYIYIDGLTYFRANLTNESHILNVDNANGAGHLGLDYVEVISVTGGLPLVSPPHLPEAQSNPKHKTAIGKIVGPVVGIGVPLLVVLVILAILFYKRRRHRDLEELPQIKKITPFEHSSPTSVGNEKGSTPTEPGGFTASTPILSASVIPSSTGGGTSTTDASSFREQYVSEKGRLAVATSASRAETPDQVRVRELQAELARAREDGGGANMAELQAMRRDLQQLMQIVDRPRPANDYLPPPEYAAT